MLHMKDYKKHILSCPYKEQQKPGILNLCSYSMEHIVMIGKRNKQWTNVAEAFYTGCRLKNLNK